MARGVGWWWGLSVIVRYTTCMSKRLQVVVGDDELERYQRTAEATGQTVSEWVRQALREAERKTSSGDVEAKLVAYSQGRELWREGRTRSRHRHDAG